MAPCSAASTWSSPLVVLAVTAFPACRDAPPPPPTTIIDARPPESVATPALPPEPPTTLPEPEVVPLDQPAVDELCRKVIALPVPDGGVPFLAFGERLRCSSKFAYFQQKMPNLFSALKVCVEWAHDATELQRCVDKGKHDPDGGTFVPPKDRL
jgi:hypothetical protein